MGIESPRELFLHELGMMLDAEHEFLRAHTKMRRVLKHPQAKQTLARHLEDTRQQIVNLTMVFDAMNEEATQVPCPGAKGITKEYLDGVKQLQRTSLLDAKFVLNVTLKGKTYEVTAYQELVGQARALDEQQAAQLLLQNLEQEQVMVKRVKQLIEDIDQKITQGD